MKGNINEIHPKVFISYSHDSEEHKTWVLKLATHLRRHGVDIILDQWDVRLGDDLPFFMEQGLTNSTDLFNDEFDYREVTNWQELTNLAVALFIGIAGGPATAPSGGGGSSTDNNWGRDKDEDDLRWTRRCAKAATQKLGKQIKYGYRR